MVAFFCPPPFMKVAASDPVVTVSANVTGLVLRSLFTSTDWVSTKGKTVIINSGVTVSASSSDGALRAQLAGETTAWGGTLTLVNNGIIQGIGGAANGGVGGNAIFAGTYTAPVSKIIVSNTGTIRAGGGGGGQGGSGSSFSTGNTVGGPGGRGQGADGSAGAGAAGGMNAGTGGTGGTWGTQGGAGSAGNVGAGAAGGLGGVAYNTSTVTMNNMGTVQGRVL